MDKQAPGAAGDSEQIIGTAIERRADWTAPAAAPALEISGYVCEIGLLEDEEGGAGICIKREGGQFVTVKGLPESEVRKLGPFFCDNVTVSFRALATTSTEPTAPPTADVGGLTDEKILKIQEAHIPRYGWSTNGIAFARAIEREVLASIGTPPAPSAKQKPSAWAVGNEVFKTLAEAEQNVRNPNLKPVALAPIAPASASASPAAKFVRIKVDYAPPFGKRGWVEVFAQEFSIEGADSDRFAVHNSVNRIGEYTATHIETGFAIDHGETPEEAIEHARAKWTKATPEERAEKMARAKSLTSIAKGERAKPDAIGADSIFPEFIESPAASPAAAVAAPAPAPVAGSQHAQRSAELSKHLREVAANPKADAISYLKRRMVLAADEIDRLAAAAPAAPSGSQHAPEEVGSVNLSRLLRNLEETSSNEGSHDLACRCADALAVIRGLLAAPAVLVPAEPQPVDAARWNWFVKNGFFWRGENCLQTCWPKHGEIGVKDPQGGSAKVDAINAAIDAAMAAPSLQQPKEGA